MCQGSKTEYSCGHTESQFSSPCGKKCSTPSGETTFLDKGCPRCDPETKKEKQQARIEELKQHFGHDESVARVQKLAERSSELSRSMKEGIIDAQRMMYGAAPSDPLHKGPDQERIIGRSWGPHREEDSGSDDGRRDGSYLTDDGQHVYSKEYVLMNGHYALISVKKEVQEVDPYIVEKLREKRDKAIAKLEAKGERKAEKKKEKEREEETRAKSREAKERISRKVDEVKSQYEAMSLEKKQKEGSPSRSVSSDKASADMRRTGTAQLSSEARRQSPESVKTRAALGGYDPTSGYETDFAQAAAPKTLKPRGLTRSKKGVSVQRSSTPIEADRIDRKGKAVDRGGSSGYESDDEDLDIWQKIADE
ncbi:hypothetical protein F4808DRAFT_469601 [Astrocystis sublimbata]|nr:hypothetical protein F4808DRAFT_469601 [Astrocystis sublimbata]